MKRNSPTINLTNQNKPGLFIHTGQGKHKTGITT